MMKRYDIRPKRRRGTDGDGTESLTDLSAE
jgi:hypothetical protein